MPPSRVWTTWVCRDGTTRPLPRLTSSSTAKCAQTRNATSRARNVNSSMREVRGVRSAAAARMSLAKAKSDGGIGLLHQWLSMQISVGSRSRPEPAHGLPCRIAITLSRGPSATRRPLSNSSSRSTMLSSERRWVEMMIVIRSSRMRLQPFQKFGFAANVEMRGRLVQEQHPGLPDQDAGQSDRLLLAAGEAAASLGDRHVVAHRMAGDEALHARRAARPRALPRRWRRACPSAMLSRSFPKNRSVSCIAKPMPVRRSDGSYCRESTPSTRMRPSCAS